VKKENIQVSGVSTQSSMKNKDVTDTKSAVVSVIKAMQLFAYYSAVVSLKVEDVKATVCLDRGMEARPLDDCLQKMTQLIKVPG